MWTVKWMSRGQEETKLDVEDYMLQKPNVVLEACRMRLPEMKKKNPGAGIDGFIVVGDDDEIVRSYMPYKRLGE